jgi:hypothetical protein
MLFSLPQLRTKRIISTMKYNIDKRTVLYKVCKRALALPHSYNNEVAYGLIGHLVDLILWWLQYCCVFNPSLKFQQQQTRILHFLSTSPPPPYYPIIYGNTPFGHLPSQKYPELILLQSSIHPKK